MQMCPECFGAGVLIVCCDDMCHGIGYCMHGDGEVPCPECEGEGEIADELDELIEITDNDDGVAS